MFQSSGFWWPDPLEFQEQIRDYCDGPDLAPDIPTEATIILVHQGYLAMWTHPELIDRRVYVWPPNDETRIPGIVAESFEEWLATFPFLL